MAEVRRYFCCTDNLTGCKIIGGIQIAGNAIMLLLSLITVTGIAALVEEHKITQEKAATLHALFIFAIVVFGLGILCAILLVVAASKRSTTMLMVWIILNSIGCGCLVYQLLEGPRTSKAIIQNLFSIGIAIWAQLIAIGARQEVQSGANIV